MTPNDDDMRRLQTAVQTIWIECGETPPVGVELQLAAGNLRNALALGRRIPRQIDKTLQPMAGRRDDIELAAIKPVIPDARSRASIALSPPLPPSTTRE